MIPLQNFLESAQEQHHGKQVITNCPRENADTIPLNPNPHFELWKFDMNLAKGSFIKQAFRHQYIPSMIAPWGRSVEDMYRVMNASNRLHDV